MSARGACPGGGGTLHTESFFCVRMLHMLTDNEASLCVESLEGGGVSIVVISINEVELSLYFFFHINTNV